MHVAVAVGTPTIGIFGSAEPDIWFPYEQYGPYIPAYVPITCRPCHSHVCSHISCLYKLTVDTVEQHVLVVLPFKGKVVHKATEIMTTVKHPDFPVDMLVRTPRQVEERISLGDFFMKEILEKGTVIYEAAYA